MWERDEVKKLISGSTGGLRICGYPWKKKNQLMLC